MIKIKDISGRKHHTRWSVEIPKKDTVIEDVNKFFGIDPKVRSAENIIKNLKADPNIDIDENYVPEKVELEKKTEKKAKKPEKIDGDDSTLIIDEV